MMWKDKYKIGIDEIDKQHEELFGRVSDFNQAIRSDEDWETRVNKVKETMAFMKDYVITHFNEEEAYQEEINYPYLEEHRDAHIKFKESVNNYVKIFEEEGFTEEKIQEFGGKLMTWLIMHVGNMDQKIGEYVKSKGG
ncbi:bacteriohemerythrin [Acetivibrio clariflavus]|uniref:bacteriohemerythrin n=1 Tax=Acetivibrio clariflavus TaxID=288965 RepID=UPI000489D5E1|nr:hemerythrin family protein [Acetivibrio clariflavus]HOQ00474.1 hemerythrin family protein [Acetivibrio clariflavus]HPU42503.1 hemerythrin family protein [Acetivibrio clariflavus]